MPKLPLRSREIMRRLRRLGFKDDHVTGSHVVFFHQKTGYRAVVPKRSGDLPKGTVRSILREANINLKDFLAN